MQAQMTAPDLATIVESSATMMLGLDIGVLVDGDAPASNFAFGASVGFTGDWNGAVVVTCDDRLGREAAAAMFGNEPADVSGDEIADAVGELANMIGGNVKPLLPGAATLSLPTVIQGSDLHLGIAGASVWVGIAYRRGDASLDVHIYESTK